MNKNTAHPFEGGIKQFSSPGFWIAIGLILGTVAGALTGHVGAGISIGIVFGVAIGQVLASRGLGPAGATADEETTE